MKESLLMCDSTEGDGKAESVMDYIMSYSLRHAESKYLTEKPTLCRYCKYMLCKLLELEQQIDDIKIEKVEVWRQWQYIDLRTEITLFNKGVKEYYALLIEDKYYSPLRYYKDSNGEWHNQMEYYKDIFEKYYEAKNDYNWNTKYALVSCFEREDTKICKYDEVKSIGVNIFAFYDIIDNAFWHEDVDAYEETESEIFNEFWLRKW